MTNPDNTVGTNAGYNGRTTPNAFNDILSIFEGAGTADYKGRGIVSGWACSPKSGMTIQLGGDGVDRDVAIAEDNAGNRTTINNRTATPVEITLDGAPATNNRIDSIVAYVDNPQQGAGSTDVDFPSQVGIIAVKGTVAANPNAPTEAQIRTAITADGATGASAYYVVLANITVGTGVTTIGSGVISQGTKVAPNNNTANNLKPASDTPASWRTVVPNGATVWTFYNTAGCFTNQPSTYGQLETLRAGAEIYQKWHTQSNGETFYRAGNTQGWYGNSGNSGTFRKIIDNSQSATVTSDMINWTTLPSLPFNSTNLGGYTPPTGWTNFLALDISSIPTGMKFTVIASYYYRAPAALGFLAIRSSYNGISAGHVYSSQPTAEFLNGTTSIYQFTKAAGQNTVWIQWLGASATAISDGALYTTAVF